VPPPSTRLLVLVLVLVQGSSPADRRSHELRTNPPLLFCAGDHVAGSRFRVRAAGPTGLSAPGSGNAVAAARSTREHKRAACSGSTKSTSGPSATCPAVDKTVPAPAGRLHLGDCDRPTPFALTSAFVA
jgi:hypothetical protein